MEIKFYSGEYVPLEMHRVRIVQKLNLRPIEERYKAIEEAGNNTFLLKSRDVFLDMLTDSGVNAMSAAQQAAMMDADDSYAGSESFFRLEKKTQEIFDKKYFLPVHQGRAAENVISRALIKNKGQYVPMNYHFTTSRAHIQFNGGVVKEFIIDEGLQVESDFPFKGNMNIEKLHSFINEVGSDAIAFVRMEAGTNLIGGQPFALENLEEVSSICKKNKIVLVLDASLLMENLYFLKTKDEKCKRLSIRDITKKLSGLVDILYFSARKLGCARGGGICTSREDLYGAMREYIPLFEGFLTYGGMSVREMEAIVVGLDEAMDEQILSQSPMFIKYMAKELQHRGIPIVTPAGGLGCHIDAKRFLEHIPQEDYPAGALASAFYIASGVRGMERGTLSEERDENGKDIISNMELLRLAVPRRVFTMSQLKYVVDRLSWLYANRKLIGGLKFVEEPKILRFFLGRLAPISDWQKKLVQKFRNDFGDAL